MKGIIFTESNFHLTVQGIKKQTRRIIKPQPDDEVENLMFFGEPCFRTRNEDDDFIFLTPRYKVGETVYLKEPYHVFDEENNLCLYKYPPKKGWMTDKEFSDIVHSLSGLKGWRNKLFMPEKYARYFIKITNVRAKRLQDISEEDCIKEGITSYLLDPSKAYTHIKEYGIKDYMGGFNTPQEAYSSLIDSIDGKGTWESNPFVWVYDYELKTKEL